MSLILGVHVSQKSNVLDDKEPSEIHLAIQRDTNKLGLNAAQIFTYGPRLLVPNNINVKLVKSKTIPTGIVVVLFFKVYTPLLLVAMLSILNATILPPKSGVVESGNV